jgi:exo-rhamnogalacturonan lyase-like protein
LCPTLRKDEYDSANGTIDEHRIYFYLHGGAYKLRQGVTKTHDVWLEFGKKSSAAIRAEQQLRMAAAPAQWYAASKVFGELSIPKPSGILKQYDQAFAQSFTGYLKDRETSREYGMLNFGDWWGERFINWGNSEYDTQHSFMLQFARTGNFDYFRRAEEMEWHNRDIDAVHYNKDPLLRGAVYAHAIGHTGDYYQERPTAGAPSGGFREGSPHSHMAADHTFIEGHFDYYFLTGDRRSFDTAIGTADRYNSYFTKNYDFNNCRQPGWHIILAMAAYNATNDPYYLNAAKMIVDRVLERQTPDGGWKRQMVPGHCYCTPRHQGNAGFMVGVLLTGLRRYYDATGDERTADSIVKAAHFLINDLWTPEKGGFRYTSCPKSSVGTGSNFLLFEGIVFAHRRTGDAQMREVLLKGTDAALESMAERGKKQGGAWGKGFTQYTRVVPHYIDHLAGLKEESKGTKLAQLK